MQAAALARPTSSGKLLWSIKRIALFVFASLATYLIEEQFNIRPELLYPQLVTAGFREPQALNVTLVTLRKGREPEEILNNDCPHRAFMARLLHVLQKGNPGEIVIDVSYGNTTKCGKEDNETKALKDAVFDVTKTVPLVTALDSTEESELRADQSSKLIDLKRRGLKPSDQIVEDELKFQASLLPWRHGLYRLNYDTRKIPLSWPTYWGYEEVGTQKPREEATLAVAAVEGFRPQAFQRRRLGKLQAAKLHPFSVLLPEDKFLKYSAIDLLCGSQESDWSTCEEPKREAKYWENMRTRIVLIGQRDPSRDFHTAYIGEAPGYLLHANYIESILDDTYLSPIGQKAALAIRIAVFALLVVFIHTGRIMKALILTLSVAVFVYPQFVDKAATLHTADG